MNKTFFHLILDTSKHGTRVTPETPLALKALPKAQWSLQRFEQIRKKYFLRKMRDIAF